MDGDEDLKNRFDECQKQVQHYQGIFPSIPTMTSEELVATRNKQQQQHQERQLILVDVRTRVEQETSMIPGAITLDEFHRRMDHTRQQQQWQQKQGGGIFDRYHPSPTSSSSSSPTPNQLDDSVPEIYVDSIVVTYCTVGYRSGREAQHLADKYPNFFRTNTTYSSRITTSAETTTIGNDKSVDREDPPMSGGIESDNVDEVDERERNMSSKVELEPNLYNLDGILAYTYVEGAPPLQVPRSSTMQSSGGRTTAPTTTTTTTKVHTYGPAWNHLAHPDYEPVWFRTYWDFGCHAVQTVGCSVARSFQHFGSIIKTKFLTCRNGCCYGSCCRNESAVVSSKLP